MKDLVYEFFKITAQYHKHFNLPSEEKGSGYRQVYSVSKLDLSDIDPKEIILIKGGKDNSVMKQVRLMDAGYEILHPRVLLGLLQSGNIPENWKDNYNIDFLGAWFCATGNWIACCNPLTISVFWHDRKWKISYDDLTDAGYDHYIAVIKRR